MNNRPGGHRRSDAAKPWASPETRPPPGAPGKKTQHDTLVSGFRLARLSPTLVVRLRARAERRPALRSSALPLPPLSPRRRKCRSGRDKHQARSPMAPAPTPSARARFCAILARPGSPLPPPKKKEEPPVSRGLPKTPRERGRLCGCLARHTNTGRSPRKRGTSGQLALPR